MGFQLEGHLALGDLGVEIDQVARGGSGALVWFEYKGSFQGTRPGLMRTDTLKKAIANAALLRILGDHPPYVLLTSHVPKSGSALAMLETSRKLGYFADVICVNDPSGVARLKHLG
jgi:hypothetical protein